MRALLLVALLGCSAAESLPLADYGARAGDALCAWAVRCRHVPDDATCRRNSDPKESDTRLAAWAVSAGRIRYDGEAAARCVAATEAAACQAVPFTDASCRGIFVGTVAEGGQCLTSKDCAGRAPCLLRTCDARQCCAGVCGAPPEPEPPREVAGVGEPCVTHTDCDDTAYCETDRRCTALPDQAGERCLYGCAWGDLRCDVDSLTCVAYQPLGAACAGELDCDAAYAFCDGVCRPLPGPGEPCGGGCIPAAWCGPDGICAARGEAGAPCLADDQCSYGCDEISGVCVDFTPCD